MLFNRVFGDQSINVCEGHVSAQCTGLVSDEEFPAPPNTSVLRVLSYARRQVLPVYTQAAAVAQQMQGVYGSVVPQRMLTDGSYTYNCSADDTFFRSNSCTISKLMDLFNVPGCDGKLKPSTGARLVMLAAVYCATAQSSNTNSVFHVSQLLMTDMCDKTTEILYKKEPEKQHVTLLMRGESAGDRIKRFNLAVRIFPRESEFVRDLMPKVIGLNATLYSPVMVLTGVFNNQAAAIFLSSETMSANVHSVMLKSFASTNS
jgi:hypothetical protein